MRRTTWIVALTLLLSLPVAAAQSYRGTGAADVVVGSAARRFHAFEMTVDGQPLATASWRLGTGEGWLLFDALLVEPDVDVNPPEDPNFALLWLLFYLNPTTGQVAALPLHLPAIHTAPNQATYLPLYEVLHARTVVTVTSFHRGGNVMSIAGTVDAMLGRNGEHDCEPDPARAIALRGTFDLREVVPDED